ncbi:MAG: NTP transferase domain-containing protein [Spirochaetota bacterium]|nr:MAG: NTP transferase domain-containing protein [Spirochaetota bacterium]
MKEIFVHKDITIKDALKKFDETARKVLIVVDERNLLLGALTDGDVRRHILKGGNLDDVIEGVYNDDPVFLYHPWNIKDMKELMLTKRIEAVPIVNDEKVITDVLFWSDVFKDSFRMPARKIDLPVVIMAGGKGTRLDPFTRILPKPLIPIGDKPVIEIIIDRFIGYGVKDFYVSINYKGEMIRTYFDYLEDKNYMVNYIQEATYSGTAGSLRLLPANFPQAFILTNCDIIVDADYYDVLQFHKTNRNCVTVLGSIQHHVIPYGIVEFEKKGVVNRVVEKPEYDITINTGVYVIERKAIGYIPKNKMFHVTDLINLLLRKGKRVGVYPVSEKAYIDIGQWEEYRKTIALLKS